MKIAFTPSAALMADISEGLGILGLSKARLTGHLEPLGQSDWRLTGKAEGTVTQACVVTLDPVRTRIEEPLERTYLAELPDPGPGEIEMPEDDTVEGLPDILDLSAVLSEALALALPPYPRADGADLGPTTFAEPGVTPMSDADIKPFAGLKALRDTLAKNGDDDPENGG